MLRRSEKNTPYFMDHREPEHGAIIHLDILRDSPEADVRLMIVRSPVPQPTPWSAKPFVRERCLV
jgi:hypothetical protein